MAEKKKQLKNQVEIAYKVIESYYELYKKGELSEKEAKEKAKLTIRNLRFDNCYFWIINTKGFSSRLIMHPIMTELKKKTADDPIFLRLKAIEFGKDKEIIFKKKRNIFEVISQIIEKSKEGFIFYEWAKPLPEGGATKEFYPKLSYIKFFEPWGWVIGTGIYIDDIKAEMWGDIKFLFLIIVLGFGALFLFLVFIISSFSRDINRIIEFMRRAREENFGKRIDIRLDIKRKDEIRDIAIVLEKFAWLEKIFYTTEIPIALLTKENRFIDCNEAAAKLFNYKSREEFLKEKKFTPWELSPPFQPDGRSSVEKAKEMIRIAFKKGCNKFEWMHRNRTGRDFPVEVTLIPIVYKEERLYCVWRDLSKEKALYDLSITDPLTQIYNRRYFISSLENEIERVKRGAHPFSLIMADIDKFKNINDTFGHLVGDKVLVEMVKLFKGRLRKIDIICRWGGEEFVILLPETPVDKAVAVAEELRKSLENMYIDEIKGHITASFGVVGYCPDDTVNSIIERVDAMMYKAKLEGRNCVRSTDKCE
ncbi:MAG: diguanylate cyclase [Thermodesulfobacterium sp.]|nr:diguanylate cyclase [Thermodesulfobacterium sp.]